MKDIALFCKQELTTASDNHNMAVFRRRPHDILDNQVVGAFIDGGRIACPQWCAAWGHSSDCLNARAERPDGKIVDTVQDTRERAFDILVVISDNRRFVDSQLACRLFDDCMIDQLPAQLASQARGYFAAATAILTRNRYGPHRADGLCVHFHGKTSAILIEKSTVGYPASADRYEDG